VPPYPPQITYGMPGVEIRPMHGEAIN